MTGERMDVCAEQLIEDHSAIDKILKELEAALRSRETTEFFSPEEQAHLAKQITAELEKRPSRFTDATWSHVNDVGAS